MGRCAKHDLAVGPDGRCVVCKREESGSVAPAVDAPVAKDGRLLLAALAAFLLIALVVGGLVTRRGMPPTPARLAAAPETPRPIETAARRARDDDGARAASDQTASGGPTEAQMQAAMQRVPITMYTTAWCPVCKRAKRWLTARSIPFTERDVEADPAAAQARSALTSSRGVPTIDVDGDVMVGFDASGLEKSIRSAASRRL